MKSGIYKIEHKESGKVYIGSSANVLQRLNQHRSHLKKLTHTNPYLLATCKKYGYDSFEIKQIITCHVNDLLFYEQLIIDGYKANQKEHGYNLRVAAPSNLGMTFDGVHKAGDKYGRLTLIKRHIVKANQTEWDCVCDCGKHVIIDPSIAKSGAIHSCGCLKKDILRKLKRHVHFVGDKYNKLTFVSPKDIGKNDSAEWLVRCDCGIEKYMLASRVKRGIVVSCGCYRNELAAKRKTTHGLSKTKEHLAWMNMKARCDVPTHISYKSVGGKGIKVCNRWRDSFECFIADMGECPDKHQLFRIDQGKDFSPDNCKWATMGEQMLNNKNSITVILNGNLTNVSIAEQMLGIYRSSINQRVRHTGETYQQATDHFAKKRGML